MTTKNGSNGTKPDNAWDTDSGSSPGDRVWTDGIARLIIASAIEGDLIEKLPGAFTADLFGEPGARQRIASVIEQYIKQYTGRPTVEIVGELLRRDMATRSQAEQQTIEDEWGAIQAITLPDDPTFVEKEVREWIEFRMARAGLLAAREAMDRPGGLEEMRKILAETTAPTTGTSGRLVVSDAMDMLREPAKPIGYHLKPLLPEKTLGLLTSYTGEGKTTLLYPMFGAVACGERFLGMPVKQTNVLILAVEEDRDTVIRRLRRFVERPTLGTGRLFVHAASLTASEQTYRDIRRVAEDNDIGLILVDTLAQFWTVKEENNNAEVALAMREFLSIAHDDGRSVWLSHHDGKAEGARRSRGASSLPGIVDLHLALSRVKGANKADPRRVLSIEKRRNDEIPWEDLNLTLLDGNTWTWTTADTAPEQTPADRVVAALRQYTFTADANPEGMTPAEIGLNTGLRGGSLDRAIEDAGERLVSNGKGSRGRRYTIRTNSQEVAVGANGANGENANDDAE